ncbi:MAG: NTP transferase domain-containing protein [Nocardioides alkalitolerans]
MSGLHGRPGGIGGIVLAGGRGSRLGGVRKADLRHDGATLLDRALAACADCAEVVVVGDPPAGGRAGVRFVREEPAYGGPAAALLAGAAASAPGTDLLVVLAVDMPLLHRGTVARLLAAAGAGPALDGAALVDATGRRQLAMVLRRAAVDRVAPPPADRSGLPLHRLLDALDLATVPARADEAGDVDSWDDAARLRVEALPDEGSPSGRFPGQPGNRPL